MRFSTRMLTLAGLVAGLLTTEGARADHDRFRTRTGAFVGSGYDFPSPIDRVGHRGRAVGLPTTGFPTGYEPIAPPRYPAGPDFDAYPPRGDFGPFPIAPTPIPGPQFPGGGACRPGASPVVAMADELIVQVEAFLQVFGPTRCVVPQGERFYADALALHRALVDFRQAAALGASPHDLRRLYGRVDSACCRLVSRLNRLAGHRTGPNIEQIRLIGALCNQLGAYV